jgi:hypothetical protein
MIKMGNGEVAVVEQQQALTLIYETNPVTILEDSKAIANALADIIKDKKLYTVINSKDYVHVEGWTTLGALVKVFPILDWSRRLDREDEVIYESRVIAQTIKGEVIGIGEALASGNEKTKSGKARWTDEYAIKSMSITRATSKALRIPLGWIMVLAGYEGTPFEEMTKDMEKTGNGRKPAPAGGKKKPANAKKPAKPTTPQGVDPDNVQDAEVTEKIDFKALSKKSKAFKKVCDVITTGGFDLDELTIWIEAGSMNTNGKLTDKELDEVEVLLGRKPA